MVRCRSGSRWQLTMSTSFHKNVFDTSLRDRYERPPQTPEGDTWCGVVLSKVTMGVGAALRPGEPILRNPKHRFLFL